MRVYLGHYICPLESLGGLRQSRETRPLNKKGFQSMSLLKYCI
jgi:hypothetical protein